VVITTAVIKARQKGPLIGEAIENIQGGQQQMGLVVYITARKEDDSPVPFNGRGGDPFILLLRSEQRSDNTLIGLWILRWDERPGNCSVFMEKPPEHLVDPHGIEPLGTCIRNTLVAFVAQSATIADSLSGGTSLKVFPDLLLYFLVGKLNGSM
jgi:hypothetical protein